MFVVVRRCRLLLLASCLLLFVAVVSCVLFVVCLSLFAVDVVVCSCCCMVLLLCVVVCVLFVCCYSVLFARGLSSLLFAVGMYCSCCWFNVLMLLLGVGDVVCC